MKKKIIIGASIVFVAAAIFLLGSNLYTNSKILKGIPLSYAEGFRYNNESYSYFSRQSPMAEQESEFVQNKISELGDYYHAGYTENSGFFGKGNVFFIGDENKPCLIKVDYDNHIYISNDCNQEYKESLVIAGIPLGSTESFSYGGETYNLYYKGERPSGAQSAFIQQKISQYKDYYFAGYTEESSSMGRGIVSFIGDKNKPCLIKISSGDLEEIVFKGTTCR